MVGKGLSGFYHQVTGISISLSAFVHECSGRSVPVPADQPRTMIVFLLASGAFFRVLSILLNEIDLLVVLVEEAETRTLNGNPVHE